MNIDKINELLDKRNKLSQELDMIDNEISECEKRIKADEFVNKCYIRREDYGNDLYRIVRVNEVKNSTCVSALVETIFCSVVSSMANGESIGFSHSMTNCVFDTCLFKEIPLVMFERYRNKAQVIDGTIKDFNKDFTE